MEEEILICECSSPEHIVIISYDKETNLAYVLVHLANHKLWKRLKIAFRYILGKKSIYGSFEEVVLSEHHVDKLENLVDRLKNKE